MPEYQSTKRGKPLGKRSRNGYGLQWTGRDDSGISVWEGQPQALRFGYWVLLLIGGAMVSAGAFLAVLGNPASAIALGGFVQLGLAWWMRSLHNRMASLGTTAELSKRLGVDREDLIQWAEENRILPKAILNREPLYDPADLGDPGLLLRASTPPTDTLMRAASVGPGSNDNLLQPVEPPAAVADLSVTAQTDSCEVSATADRRG